MNENTMDAPHFSEEAAAQIYINRQPEEDMAKIAKFREAPETFLEITVSLNGVVVDRMRQPLTRADICRNLCGKIESALTTLAHEVVKYSSHRLWDALRPLFAKED